MSSTSRGKPADRRWPHRSDRPSRARAPRHRRLGAFSEALVVLTVALALSLLIKTFLAQAYSIPSESMEDTLHIGDRVLISKLTPGPFDLQRGDVIVFKDPGGWLDGVGGEGVNNPLIIVSTFLGLLPEDYGKHLIKRVIGLPGDTVECCDAHGRLTVNGTSIDEPYLRPGDVPSEEKFSATVKPDNLWVMGDHRSQSADSRAQQHLNDGQIPMADVVGKALFVAWPLGHLAGVDDSHEVFAKVPSPAPSPSDQAIRDSAVQSWRNNTQRYRS